MSKPTFIAGLALVVGVVALVMPAVLMITSFTGGRSEVAGGCTETVEANAATRETFSTSQLANAQTVIAVGQGMNVPARGVLIALAAAHQESRFQNYANDGLGRDLEPEQAGVERSLSLPHDAVGSDHGSLGIFQQQWPWWGSIPDLMDPAASSRKFFMRLMSVRGWQEMSVTAAAQAVQRSAYPDAYADDEAIAASLMGRADLTSGSVEEASWTSGSEGGPCVEPATFSGRVVSPLPASARFTDQRNFGGSGQLWSRGHTGTDLSTACGTPVVAANDGVVSIETDQAWAGKWLVKVGVGEGRLHTWYAHMQSVSVVQGQRVRAGQKIGAVGSLGNSTGCHLHFEVHPQGGSIYEDDEDPSKWLEDHLSGDVAQVVNEAATGTEPLPDHLIASFNVLGHSHTKPGGNKPSWANSRQRMRWAVQLLDRYGVGVVGFQELEPPQRNAFLAFARDRYSVFSPHGETSNSIAWHRGRWAFVSGSSFTIPYFNGQKRHMPMVRLRDVLTGLDSIFLNVHNPADTKRFPAQARFRREAVRREVAIVRSLDARYSVLIFITGDFNERHDLYCAMTAGGRLSAAAGGSDSSTCRPPKYEGIDWIFGTNAAWRAHGVLKRGIAGKVTDHPLVLAQVATPMATGGDR
ncbi:hypothetical protein EKO23_01810 [Nocardioides guangzhouensis]|uniref:M23 family metallopeptidase n=1 Tax=Nocardioides guangzhouensis TaxID=2497878 RepID=A0A4Q4ZJZ5_9ACTN|nr:peptidoglycan DD-metalloendopeptidase family protein [Nocardioides guangzhouensis]RYP88650.1 hypothetical protein EKO23_01810 [Nocardioides guangzhouensis]